MDKSLITSLKDLCNNFKADIVDGPFGANLKREHYQLEGIPVLKIQNIKPFKITLKKMDYVTEEKYLELKRHSYCNGDIIMTKLGNPLGESAIVEGVDDGLIVADLVRIRAQKIETRYLCYHLNSPVTIAYINSQQKGTTRPRVRISVVRDLPIYTPPIPEQKRIVALLDAVFSDLEKTRAKTEKNLKNARELFESKKLNLFENLSNSSDLNPLPLVCENIFAGGDAPKKGLFSREKTEEFNIPIYANAVKKNGLYGFTDYSRANKPSITIAARGSGTGHIELRTEPFLPIVRLIVLTPNKEIISLEYLKHALQTLDILRSGSAIPQLTVPMIKEYSIPVPDLKVQNDTVIDLENLTVYIERVEAIYKKKIVALDELKKSILQKAFSGELATEVR